MKLNFGKAALQRSRFLEAVHEVKELEERSLHKKKFHKIPFY